MKKLTLEWLYAAAIRAIKTIAQTALGMFTVGMAMQEIDWLNVLSVSAVAGIFSLLTSLATKLPEVGSDGSLKIDTSGAEEDSYLLVLDADLDTLGHKKKITLTVDADLSGTSRE